MTAGSTGTYAVAWDQTESDGVIGAAPETIFLGSTFLWSGPALRLDRGPFRPERSAEDAELAGRAAQRLDLIAPRKWRGRRPEPPLCEDETAFGLRRGFTVTDGLRSYPISLVGDGQLSPYLAVFPQRLPPEDTELWVTDVEGLARIEPWPLQRGVICFTAGTWLRTTQGEMRVEDLRPGHMLLTRDNGPQEVVWIGHSQITGARLQLDPSCRPIRIAARALGPDLPDAELLVSARHRLLLRGRAAQILFNSDEVLAAAGDLVNDLTIRPVTPKQKLTYYHVLLPRHEIVWANGLPCESFHPQDMDLSILPSDQRDALFRQMPGLKRSPTLYGDSARRLLTPAEAALYRHDSPRRLRL